MMRSYLISYDLIRPGQTYAALRAELERLGAIPLLYSTWGVQSSFSAADITVRLWRHIDPNDKLLVTEIGPDVQCTRNLFVGMARIGAAA